MMRLPDYLCLCGFSDEEDDLDEELADPLLLDALLPFEDELFDLTEEEFPVWVLLFPPDLEREPDEKESLPEF
jgi:hypothetical protein